MSWQTDKAVPLLAGEPFCEKPPFTYWMSGAAIRLMGKDAWVARLPNLIYALLTALSLGVIGRRSAGSVAGLTAAAAISTLLLSYQVTIWLATDAPLLAAVSVALLGLYRGFYAHVSRDRILGYTSMHAALALAFLSKSAAAWMVPALTFAALVIWEKRWRELLRWELYAGLVLQAIVILTWIGFVYAGPDGPAHLKVFFWNNLVGRFAHVDAPDALQYTTGHRNTPGKYLLELPVYLWPWTLLVVAAARRAWQRRHGSVDELRLVRFATAVFLPALVVLSVAATARNIYLAPALAGPALLLGWWAGTVGSASDAWDVRALRATAALLVLASIVCALALLLLGWDSWATLSAPISYVVVSLFGLLACAVLAIGAARSARRGFMQHALLGILFAYCALLVGPASQIYRRVDTWQDLGFVGQAIRRDVAEHPVILFAPDETTRALVDMYTRSEVDLIRGPIGPSSLQQLNQRLARRPDSWVVVQLPGRGADPRFRELTQRLGLQRFTPSPSSGAAEPPAWVGAAHLRIARLYAVPNGRRYALLRSVSGSSLQ